MISSLKPMTVSVSYAPLRVGQMGLFGGREDLRIIEQQDPVWEAVSTFNGDATKLNVRLSLSDSTRSDWGAMYSWLKRTGMRPTVFYETAAIKKAMEAASDGRNLVCAGSLWEVDGEYYYTCWHDGEVHLYPISRPFGPDLVCPIVIGDISSPPPGIASIASS